MRKSIDLNCDMGEGFDVSASSADEALMQHITSANIACAAHAGNPSVMDATVLLAKKYGVAVGAHPGFPDKEGFGRRDTQMSPHEIYCSVAYQIGALDAFCSVNGVEMQHVKPHGALYNLAARDAQVAESIAKAVYDVNPGLILYGLAGSLLVSVGRQIGLSVASEVFADRTYQSDGALTPRAETGAMIEEVDVAVNQVRTMIDKGYVEAVDEIHVELQADTVCIHGDGAHAVNFARKLRVGLRDVGVVVKAFG